MSLINVTNLTFAYEGSYDNIFENVSFQIDTDWKLGFIGRNGRGKTTFLNLLLGKYEYSGNISSSVSFDYFSYEVQDVHAHTLDIVDCICPDYLEWELLRELSLLDISEDVLSRPFNTLSMGEQTKILLATLFLKENNFLLIDEPTNHLDMMARTIVGDYLKSKKGFILISHDRSLVDHCVDHVLSVNKSGIEVQKGNFKSWWENKQRSDSFELAENERLKKDIKRLKQAAKQCHEWADKAERTKIGKGGNDVEKSIDKRAYIGEKSRRMQQQRKNLENRQEKAIIEKSGLLKNLEESYSLKLTQLAYRTDRLLSLENISIFYGEKRVCEGISFEIKRGDRIALCGRNGSGKSSIIKLICGENLEYTGEFQKGNSLEISYVSQDTSTLSGSLSDYANRFGIEESLFKAILRKLDFSRVQFEKDIADFSAGQKKKVLIARSLSEKAHLHIWDEPLNFIDVISRIQLEELLLSYKPTILFVEHDTTFCNNIATKKVIL